MLYASAQQRGQASYYSKRATGARTSSGIRLHHDSLVCAHKTYPFGTKLLVKNLTNGKEVIVTVVDRGPHRKGRIIDLTYAAAEKIGMITKGVVAVEVSVYHPDKGIPYALEPEGLPEIDFEEHEMDSLDNDYIPVWKKSQTTSETEIKKEIKTTNIEPKTKKTKTNSKKKKSKTKKKRK